MAGEGKSRLSGIVQKHEADLLTEWTRELLAGTKHRVKESELRAHCQDFLRLLKEALQHGDPTKIDGPVWQEVRDMLRELSRTWAMQGFTPSETATFVLSVKSPLFARLKKEVGKDAEVLAEEVWNTTLLLDKLALLTTEAYAKGREEVILRQQQDMLELSTPVVKLWEGILALPIIGTLDSARSQVVMESLLTRIVETGSNIAIIDITGVPTVDTLTAQHLLKTVTAARLMGADCIISGIRPQIAQTIVHLGVDLNSVVTKASLADAFALALTQKKLAITRVTNSSAK